MKHRIRTASPDDLPHLRRLVADCVTALRAAGIDQWDETNPSDETIRADVAAGAVEVLYDDAELVACMTLDHAVDPLWMNWNWSAEGEPAVSLHRLMVHPARRGRGLAKLLLQHAEVVARGRGARSIRLDCLLQNTDAVAFYHHLGFRQTGTAEGRKGVIAGFEKVPVAPVARAELFFRFATEADCPQLAEWNHQLICDEGHRNPMNVGELEQRMRGWLAGEYRAVIFQNAAETVAYALYREQPQEIYLRQLFVLRSRRRAGFGRRAVELLRSKIWPAHKRLTVEVLVANHAAVSFWRDVGYHDYALTLEITPRSPSALSP
jgi:GNAT superfamily N-acetyltransferase